jgi:DNA-binding MarR family transcriptional regulator
MLAHASILIYVYGMENTHATLALRLLQSADQFTERLSGEFSAVHGLSVNEFLMLMHLEQATVKKLPRVELAKRMNISASTITRMAAPMEKIGLVKRQADEKDARLAFVVITKAGLEKLSQANATFTKQAGYLFDGRLNDKELSKLSELLYQLLVGTTGNLT